MKMQNTENSAFFLFKKIKYCNNDFLVLKSPNFLNFALNIINRNS